MARRRGRALPSVFGSSIPAPMGGRRRRHRKALPEMGGRRRRHHKMMGMSRRRHGGMILNRTRKMPVGGRRHRGGNRKGGFILPLLASALGGIGSTIFNKIFPSKGEGRHHRKGGKKGIPPGLRAWMIKNGRMKGKGSAPYYG